ncbi:MAG: LysM peptidoglycan-binding domain-containing protein [bacterium]
MKKIIVSFLVSLIFICPVTVNAEEKLQEIIVKDGETLWSVANKYLKNSGSWPEILKYNKLPSSDPNVILPGMKLKVPIMMIKEEYRSGKLIHFTNKVLYRKEKTVDWRTAKLNMLLFANDGLRTMEDSIASVRFYSGEIVKLDQNSLVILRPEKNLDEVELLSGAIRASRSKVISADTEIMPKIIPRGEKLDYKTKLKPNKTTLVEVYQGIVDVTAQGKTITLTKGFGAEVKYLQPPSSPHKLPPKIELGESQEINIGSNFKLPGMPQGQLLPDMNNKASSKKAKALGNLINKYRLQISKDKNFNTVISDRIYNLGTSSIDFKKMNLKDGTYYFHIAYIDELGLEGPFSAMSTVIIDTVAPELEVIYPLENSNVENDPISLKGRTEPNAKLIINNEIVYLKSDGSFAEIISSKKGKNIVEIQVSDSSGNTNKVTRTFYRVKKGVKMSREMKEEKSFLFLPVKAALGILSISVIIGVVALIVM